MKVNRSLNQMKWQQVHQNRCCTCYLAVPASKMLTSFVSFLLNQLSFFIGIGEKTSYLERFDLKKKKEKGLSRKDAWSVLTHPVRELLFPQTHSSHQNQSLRSASKLERDDDN